jgi:hypothetical protein
MWKEKEIKGIQIGKKEIKLSLFANDIMLYLNDPKDSTKKLLDLMTTFVKVVGYKTNIQISVCFLYTHNKHAEKQTRKIIPFIIISKKKRALRNKPNYRGGRSLQCKNCNVLKKQTEEDTRNWKGLLYS